MVRHLPILLLLAQVAATPAAAQIVTEGATGDAAAVILDSILDRGSYHLVDRDTVIPAGAEIDSDLLVLGSRVTIAGRVEGTVAVVRGELFIRPGASVPGPIASLNSEIFPSGMAEVGDIVPLESGIETEIAASGSSRTISLVGPPPARTVFRLPNVFGFGMPTYNRVDGLSLRWSAELASSGDTAAFALRGTIAYNVEPNTVDGGLRLTLRPFSRLLVTAQAQRSTYTTDDWIRGDLENSLAAILVRSDVRDYFRSAEVSLTLARTPPPPLIPGEGFVTPFVTARASRDRSLAAGDPWTLFGGDDGWRFNPPIDEGVLASLVGGFNAGWQGQTSSFAGRVGVEFAPPNPGDFQFAQLTASGTWSMVALYQHQIQVAAYVLLPIGSREVPLQRWSFVGGPGTLPAHEVAEYRGDHVLFVESNYLVPVPAVRLPIFGSPSIRLLHAAGMAWRTGTRMPRIAQNLGAGLRLGIVDLMVYVNPDDRPLDPEVHLGAQIPLGLGPLF
ncbi:MAG: hypothetical protein GEU90_01215 [Gemmatimonas sp.]|nr:hypothetical protein [Gemmatimonas sp.]